MAKPIIADGFSFEQNQRQKRCQQRKRQAGLCVKCNKPSEKFRCDECRKVHNEAGKQFRDKRIEEGKCEKCGGENTTDITVCAECKEKLNQRQRDKYNETNKKASRVWAANNVKLGFCRACGGLRETETTQHCDKCERNRRSCALKRIYGITIEEYEELAAEQGWVCWICKGKVTSKNGNLLVDHSHKTGKVRGLLCTRCNAGIGGLRDSLKLLARAIEYLQTFGE